MNEPMAGVAKHLKGFPWRYGVGRASSTAVKRSLFNSVVGRNNCCRFRSTQIEISNRRPGSAEPGIWGKIFMKTVYPPAIRAAQITRSFASKGAIRQYDGGN
jgi:hypothetical protein